MSLWWVRGSEDPGSWTRVGPDPGDPQRYVKSCWESDEYYENSGNWIGKKKYSSARSPDEGIQFPTAPNFLLESKDDVEDFIWVSDSESEVEEGEDEVERISKLQIN